MIPSLWKSLRELAGGDAVAFVARANQESLLPLLAAERDLAPDVAAAIQRSAALVAAHRMRSAIIAKAFRRALELLDGERSIVLKGCDFAHRLYPRPEMRPMADIDVLVGVNDIDRIVAGLEARGVARSALPGVAILAKSHHEVVMTIDGVTFEVHNRFIQKARHRIDYDAVFARAVPFGNALRLADADALAYETISIAIKYFTSPLIRYVDVWLLLADPATLEASAARAIEWRARRAFYATFRFGSRVFPEFREERFERVMRDIVSKRTAKFLDERVIPQPQRGMKSVPSRSTQLWQKFWLLDDPMRRTAFLAEHAGAVASGALRASIAPRLTE